MGRKLYPWDMDNDRGPRVPIGNACQGEQKEVGGGGYQEERRPETQSQEAKFRVCDW